MIGGGPGSMIGSAHRIAARIDNHYELVGGVFSRDYQKSQDFNTKLGLSPARIYSSYHVLLEQEKSLSPTTRMEVVSIVTPNDSHFDIAAAALKAGFHVIIDKPMTNSMTEAKKLRSLVHESENLFCVTYTYSGYPMIKEMRFFLRAHKLGEIRKVLVTFTQGWLATYLEANNENISWRLNPQKNVAGTLGDIGTHAFHLAEYVSGLQVTEICADIGTIVPKRLLNDDISILLKFKNGARGALMVSQVAAGDEVNIDIRVYCEKGSLHWSHGDPNSLQVKWLDKPMQILRYGSDNAYLHVASRYHCRTTSGHPEGYLEAFANHYRDFALCLHAKKNNLPILTEWNDYPTIEDGVRGVAFVESVLATQLTKEKWVRFNCNS